MKNITKLLITTFAALFIFAGSANAHVTVKPSTSVPEAWETYTIKVPVEKETATTKVTLKVPEGITFVSYQPVPGWKVTTEGDKDVKTVTWAATEEGISAGQFQEFSFIAQNPKEETKVAWDAFQYYEDGEIVEWSGDEGSALPHSVTQISLAPKADAETSDHGHEDEAATDDSKATDNSKAAATADDDNDNNNETLIITLAVIALILSLVALVAALRKNKR